MGRYFLTIPEATKLVLQAGAMGDGREIFILDMGARVRIVDLAVATNAPLRPFGEIDLLEELALLGKDIAKMRHPKIDIGKLGKLSKLAQALRDLAELAHEGSGNDIHRDLNALLPDACLRVRGEAIKPPRQLGPRASWRATPQIGTRLPRTGDFGPASWD